MGKHDKRIKELEEEIRTTPYNKATQHHIGRVKAQIAKLRDDAELAASKAGGSGEGYQVRRSGDGTVILVGYPSAGKSTLLNVLTDADSEIGAYAFTTLTVVPGMMDYKGAQIQILDVPGIVHGAASGRGRGKEVLTTMRNADLCILLVDGTKPDELSSIKEEVYAAGIRLNQRIPDVKIVKKNKDGLDIGRTVRTPELDDETIADILGTFRIFNADVVIRTKIDAEQFIDVVQANKKYMPALTVINKSDLLTQEQRDAIIEDIEPDLFISAQKNEGVDELKEAIFQKLGFIRIWMKEPGKDADLDEPLIILEGSTIRDIARSIHRDFENKFKYCRVTGPSAKFKNQKKGLTHVVQDNDIVELHLR